MKAWGVHNGRLILQKAPSTNWYGSLEKLNKVLSTWTPLRGKTKRLTRACPTPLGRASAENMKSLQPSRKVETFYSYQAHMTWSQAWRAWPAKNRTSTSGSSWSSNKHGRIVCSTTCTPSLRQKLAALTLYKDCVKINIMCSTFKSCNKMTYHRKSYRHQNSAAWDLHTWRPLFRRKGCLL